MARPAVAIVPDVADARDPITCAHPQPAMAWVGAFAVAALIAHSCGYLFGVGNQVTYLIAPLHRAHPELFQNDWFTTQTTTYHSLFAIVASWLFRIEDSGVIGCAVAHAALMLALVMGVFVIVKGTTQRGALVVLLIASAWLVINGDRSLAGSYLWSGYLQPSLLATVGWIFALAAYVRGRPLLTGLALAAGGLFHANFLVLGIGMFTAAEIIAQRRFDVKRLAWLLAPQLVALVVLLPELASSARGSDPAHALWVLSKFHAPGHYDPRVVAHSLPVLLRWVAFAIVVAPVAIEFGCSGPLRRLVTWCWIAGVICALAVPVLMVPPLAGLTRLYVWRMAPFAQLAAIIVIAIAALAAIEDPSRWSTQPRWRTWTAVALGLATVVLAPSDIAAIGGWAPAVTAIGIVIALVLPHIRRLPAIVAFAGLAVAMQPRWHALSHPAVGVASTDEMLDDLYAWSRTMPVATTFLTPPYLATFRLEARRAIVVDLKSPPLVPDELEEWYHRIGEVVGDPHVHDIPAANRAWRASSADQLVARGKALGAQYVVIDRPHTEADLRRSVYANEHYFVLPTNP